MPFKTCGKCQKQVGPRTQICSCGFSFSQGKQSVGINPVKPQEAKPASSPKSPIKTVAPQVVVASSSKFSVFGKIAVPAGICPVVPEGFKKGWPDGPATDEAIVNWAINVSGLFDGRLTCEAVQYYARQFWDMHSSEYRNRVLDLIFETLSPKTNQELD